MTEQADETIVVLGAVVKTVGLKGEMKLLPGPDFWPEALRADTLVLESPDGVKTPAEIEGLRPKKNVWILKMAGVDSIDEAQRHVGDTLAVDTAGLDEADMPGELKPFQATGLSVRLADGTAVGRVTGILPGPTQDCLVVEGEGGRFLLPIVDEFVRRIDLEEGVVEIDPPEGLMEIGW